ncbi:unnamed protein product [Candida verbasci]|uniref:AP-2 complex subunit alpha n=1 Tax=Candida verbasci TaxID=1227364 RepID=A0A9W4XK30_9ASCO|nr:unnamed protein product [Candida verbasci]
MQGQLKHQSKSQFKGLNQFILDLKNSIDQDEENKKINIEIENIRSKFNHNSLNGYQKKKYLCKIIYICLLGKSDIIDFGIKECFDLINSNVFSEKKLGYLAISVLLNNDNSKVSVKEKFNYILESVFNELIKDLKSQDEEFNCLAIQFICSVFNCSEDKVVITDSDSNAQDWLEIIDLVYACFTSPLQKTILRKKSAIALKLLLQIYPEVIISNNNWTPRLIKLIDEKDLGVIISSLPLLTFVLNLKPQFVKTIIPSISKHLFKIVVENKCNPEYYYYEIPAPWLIVKLLQFLEQSFLIANKEGEQVLSIDKLDNQSVFELRQVVAKSIQNASQPIKGLSNRNSQSSILFQAVSLAVFLEASPEAINGAINALLMLLNSNETNTRYLSLDALIKLFARSNSNYLASKEKFEENLILFVKLLNDKDISVRRKSLDLLYTICDISNYTSIINQLLEYFPTADFLLKSELAIKITILAEKFATDSTWYVTTMLKLLSIGGGSTSNGVGFISNEVWERIVQIVVNNEDLQKKTCSKIIIKLLKNPNGQFSENLIKVGAFVLGEYGDQINNIEDLNINIQFHLLFDAYFKVSLLTRAMLLSTFLKLLVKFPNANFVPDIVDLFEIESQSMDLEIQTRAHEYLKLSTLNTDFKLAKTVIKPFPIFNQLENPLMNRLGSVSKIIGLNRSRSKSLVLAQNIANKPVENSFSESLSNNWYAGYHRMLYFDAGIFYEDQLIKITYRVIKNNFDLTYIFTILNKSFKSIGANITSFTVLNIESLTQKNNPNYIIGLKNIPNKTIRDKSNMEIQIKIRNIIENNESPILSLTFQCGGSFNQLNLKFPVILLKSLTPSQITVSEFQNRWTQIGQLLGIEQGESSIEIDLSHRQNYSNIVRLLTRLGFYIVEDLNFKISGAGILHSQKSNYGLLIEVEVNEEICKHLRIVVRCTGGGVSDIISSTLKEILGKL